LTTVDRRILAATQNVIIMTEKQIRIEEIVNIRTKEAMKLTSTDDMLKLLRKDAHTYVIRGLASNEKITQDVQDAIMEGNYPAAKNDRFSLIKLALLGNPAVTEQSLRRALNDKSEAVMIEAAKHKRLPQEYQLFAVMGPASVKLALLDRKDLLTSTKKILSEDRDAVIRKAYKMMLEKEKETNYSTPNMNTFLRASAAD
jgi:hypothetical protein